MLAHCKLAILREEHIKPSVSAYAKCYLSVTRLIHLYAYNPRKSHDQIQTLSISLTMPSTTKNARLLHQVLNISREEHSAYRQASGLCLSRGHPRSLNVSVKSLFLLYVFFLFMCIIFFVHSIFLFIFFFIALFPCIYVCGYVCIDG